MQYATPFIFIICCALFVFSKSYKKQFAFLFALFVISMVLCIFVEKAYFIILIISGAFVVVFFAYNLIYKVLGKTGLRYKNKKSSNVKINDKKILIFVPHEDDEINLMLGIYEKIIENNDVYVAFLTNGDGSKIKCEIRLAETISALKEYNVKEENVIFLGYGDTWKGDKHIYQGVENELFVSSAGFDKTYAVPSHPPFSDKEYKRANIVDDIENLINQITPDIIFANDMDMHIDHKAASLFLEEALCKIVKEKDYYPIVLKGLTYNVAWHGSKDFYETNLGGCKLSDDTLGGTFFSVEDVVRFPIESEGMSRCIEACDYYKILLKYKSQKAEFRADRIINSDKCFWQRRTDNLLLKKGVNISCSSGNCKYLNDFKLIPFEFSKKDDNEYWHPDKNDDNPTIKINLGSKKKVSKVVLYEPWFDSKKSYIAKLITDNGEKEIEIKAGKKNVYSVNETTQNLMLFFEKDCDICLSEIEVFCNGTQEIPIKALKIKDNKDNYVYDYWTNKDTETFVVVDIFGNEIKDNLKIETDYQDNVKTDNGEITVKPLKNKRINLSVSCNGLTDSICITKISKLKERFLQTVIKAEKRDLTFHTMRKYYSDVFKVIFGNVSRIKRKR